MRSAGGTGRTQPAQIQLLVGVANTGRTSVQVVGGSDSVTAAVRGLQPARLEVPGGTTSQLTLDVAVQCNWPSDLTLPGLLVKEGSGAEQQVTLAGAGELTTACSRGTPEALPLAVASATTITAADDDAQARTCMIVDRAEAVPCDQLSVLLVSPKGLPADIRAIRAGGVSLLMTQQLPSGGQAGTASTATTPWPHVFGGPGQTPVVLTAPASCPAQWLTTGVPSAITVDLATGYAFDVQVGATMNTWLLHASCASSPGRSLSPGPGTSSVRPS